MFFACLMAGFVAGQRYISEPEPELGLGTVISVGSFQVGIAFPASGEERLYASDTLVLKRARFREGEKVATRDGQSYQVDLVEERDGLIYYSGAGLTFREDDLSDSTSFSSPHDRLMSGLVDPGEVFDLRYKTLRSQSELRRSPLRGFTGGRVDLIPHQMYILHEVSSRQSPRVLLSDEVGLGKTIEACLIMQRLRAVGKAERILILVPETLVHQWFVELLRRFNLWFSIYDEARCRAAEGSNAKQNPFLDQQLALCSVDFLASSEVRAEQAIEAGWDLVVVDEAHHLEWSQKKSSPEYDLVEALGQESPGLLLLTATPTQLGLEGHFARLRLLDPNRYSDLEAFQEESEGFESVARIAGKIVDEADLSLEDRDALKSIFDKDLAGLEKRLADFEKGRRGAKEALLKALLDEHGTGRVVFRNSRANMTGFPKRMYCPAPLSAGENSKLLLERLAREFEAEFKNEENDVRYAFRDDPRLDWFVSFLKGKRDSKMLLICKSKRKALAIEAALQEKMNVKVALFHEDLPLVQRDRNAAWFAEPEGARILICSEIGSEGRNFQFAHHLVLFDLPSNPGLLEQRIGRLDRIGQTATVQIHVPYVVGSSQEFVADWYHQGLDAFEVCAHGAVEYREVFGNRLLEAALAYGRGEKGYGRESLEAFVEETIGFREKLSDKLRHGRDRLLELNSFDAQVAGEVVQAIRQTEKDDSIRKTVFGLMDHYGVRIEEHEGGDVFLDPRHAYVESFPHIPHEGMLATFDRERAIAREDIRFVSQDHPLPLESMALLVNSEEGTSAFSITETDTPNILLEAIFVMETVAQSSLHVDRFLAPTPLRALVDIRGNDLTHERDPAWAQVQLEDGSLNRFLEGPGFTREILAAMLDGAEAIASLESNKLKQSAKSEMKTALGAELQRLVDLRKLNENVRKEEVDLAKAEIKGIAEAIDTARLRLDSLRLIVEGAVKALKL